MSRSRWLRSTTAALLFVVTAAIVSTPAVSLWATESPELANLSAVSAQDSASGTASAPASSPDLTTAHNDQQGRGAHLVWWFLLVAAIAAAPVIAPCGWWSAVLPHVSLRRAVLVRQLHGQRAPPLLL